MQVRIGTWCGGCADEPQGTIQWAGGPTTFDNAPYVMTITSLTVQNAKPGSSYKYGDHSGLASSIVINNPSDPGNGDPPPSSFSSSASSSSSSSSSATDPPATPLTLLTTGDASPQTANLAVASVTTMTTAPTSNTLSLDSGASALSFGTIIALVFGSIVFLAGN